MEKEETGRILRDVRDQRLRGQLEALTSVAQSCAQRLMFTAENEHERVVERLDALFMSIAKL
ncbi:MAG: hypothetical protein ACYTEQ_26410 [Planctomycetota bacterium]|jgi:hypothetical protein